MGEICKICEKIVDSPQHILSLIKDPGKKSAQQEAEDMFRIYDKNKDGFISHDELKEVLSELDVNFTDIEIKEMMDNFDTDGDGQINFEEYQAMRTLMDQRFVTFRNLNAHCFYVFRNRNFIVTFERIYCLQIPPGCICCDIDYFNVFF